MEETRTRKVRAKVKEKEKTAAKARRRFASNGETKAPARGTGADTTTRKRCEASGKEDPKEEARARGRRCPLLGLMLKDRSLLGRSEGLRLRLQPAVSRTRMLDLKQGRKSTFSASTRRIQPMDLAP